MRRRTDSGQTLVEAALVIPLLTGFFLCMLQVLILAHARVLLEYAAFNAARAGVVQNGNPIAMQAAATFSMLPVYGPTNTTKNLSDTWFSLQPLEAAGGALNYFDGSLEAAVNSWFPKALNVTGIVPGWAPVNVLTTNPTQADFSNENGNAEEIDFDLPSQSGSNGQPKDAEALRKTRLTIAVSAYVPLKIPVGGRLVFYTWLVTRFIAGSQLQSDWRDWIDIHASNETLEQLVGSAPFATNAAGLLGPGGLVNAINQEIVYLVVSRLATGSNVYLFPLQASQSMQMESNAFKGNFQ